jgi:hypothetical protein
MWRFRPVISLPPSKPQQAPFFPPSAPTVHPAPRHSAFAPGPRPREPPHVMRRESAPANRFSSGVGRVVVHVAPRGQVVRQITPGAAVFHVVEQGVDDLPHRVLPGPATLVPRCLQQEAQALPLRVGKVGGIALSCHTLRLHTTRRYVSRQLLTPGALGPLVVTVHDPLETSMRRSHFTCRTGELRPTCSGNPLEC